MADLRVDIINRIFGSVAEQEHIREVNQGALLKQIEALSQSGSPALDDESWDKNLKNVGLDPKAILPGYRKLSAENRGAYEFQKGLGETLRRFVAAPEDLQSQMGQEIPLTEGPGGNLSNPLNPFGGPLNPPSAPVAESRLQSAPTSVGITQGAATGQIASEGARQKAAAELAKQQAEAAVKLENLKIGNKFALERLRKSPVGTLQTVNVGGRTITGIVMPQADGSTLLVPLNTPEGQAVGPKEVTKGELGAKAYAKMTPEEQGQAEQQALAALTRSGGNALTVSPDGTVSYGPADEVLTRQFTGQLAAQADAMGLLETYVSTVKPETVGIQGKVSEVGQNLGLAIQNIFAELPTQIDTETEKDAKGISKRLFGSFDYNPDIPARRAYEGMLIYGVARALDSNGRLSEDDVKRAELVVKPYSTLLDSPQTRIEAAKAIGRIIQQRMKSAISFGAVVPDQAKRYVDPAFIENLGANQGLNGPQATPSPTPAPRPKKGDKVNLPGFNAPVELLD